MLHLWFELCLQKILLKLIKIIKEVTLDMAVNLQFIVKKPFPNATLVTGLFLVYRNSIRFTTRNMNQT